MSKRLRRKRRKSSTVFKTGDLVTRIKVNPNRKYAVTSDKSVCKVLYAAKEPINYIEQEKINEKYNFLVSTESHDCDLIVEVINHMVKYRNWIGTKFWVNSSSFKKYNDEQKNKKS